MSRQFNFTYTFFTRSSMGIALSNGTWIKGLGQDIQERKIDILAYPTWHIPAGYNLLDFGPALNKVRNDLPQYFKFLLYNITLWVIITIIFIVNIQIGSIVLTKVTKTVTKVSYKCMKMEYFLVKTLDITEIFFNAVI